MRKKTLVWLFVLMLPAIVAAQENDIKGGELLGPGSGAPLTVGPDAFGYTGADETEATGTAFNFVDISGTGTATGLSGDDAGTGPLPIGFTFDFYGTGYTTLAMATNGYLNFNPAGDLGDFGNDCPGLNAFDPDQSIFVLWDDLIVDTTTNPAADAYHETFVACPHTGGGFGQCAIFQWSDVAHLGNSGAPFDLQAILYDNGNILLQYPAGNPESGDGATIGLENETPSSIGLDYACNTTGTITADRAILFCYPGNVCPPPPPEADLVVTKDCAVSGTQVDCTISVSNPAGPGDADNVVVIDDIPPELTYDFDTGCSAGGTTPPAPGSNGTWTWDGFNLPVGATETCGISFTANAGGDIVNSVSVSADQNDPNPGDNTALAPIGVPVQAIPTLSQFGLAALLLALVGAAFVLLRRRQTV